MRKSRIGGLIVHRWVVEALRPAGVMRRAWFECSRHKTETAARARRGPGERVRRIGGRRG